MKSLDFGRYALSSCVALAMLAGCGGSQPPIGAPGAVPQHVRNAATTRFFAAAPVHLQRVADSSGYKVSKSLLFVTDSDTFYSNVAVAVYDVKDNSSKPIATITTNVSAPGGDCIDRDGTLYVLNAGVNSNGWVSEYPLGKTKPSSIITNGINGPAFCAIDGHGNLWVTNFQGPNVTEYLKGTTEPHRTITNGLTDADGIAIDRGGNLYVGNLQPYGTSDVQVYAPGHKIPSRTITDGVTWPVGIAVDAKGTLYVTNDNEPCNVEEYLSGQSEPYREITKDIDGPTALAFAKNNWLYEVNEGTQGCTSNGPWPVILEFRPGSRKPLKKIITAYYDATGVAYYPPLLP
jgi:hypothetical protein